MAARASALLAAMWAGVLLSIGAIGAPSAFAVLAAPDAGRIAGRMFAAEAQLGIAIAVVLLLLERRRSARFETPLFTLELGLLFGAIFCTVAGYFALQPLLAVAREGRGALSFGALHAGSAVMYAVKCLLVLALAWRLIRASGRAGIKSTV